MTISVVFWSCHKSSTIRDAQQAHAAETREMAVGFGYCEMARCVLMESVNYLTSGLGSLTSVLSCLRALPPIYSLPEINFYLGTFEGLAACHQSSRKGKTELNTNLGYRPAQVALICAHAMLSLIHI